jgi:16S rRNA (cytosine967-C5)-methyltransferase
MREMRERTVELAVAVISAGNREKPVDQVLRDRLRAERELTREEGAEVSRAVFSFFRWHGWLDAREPVRDRITQALELARRFAREPERFSDEELLARVAPEWVKAEMDTSAAWARSLQAEPTLWLRASRGQGAELAQRLGDCRSFGGGALGDILEYQGWTDLFRTKDFHAGEFELQDISSQAVGFVCGPKAGETWWDACAGEGGKTMHFSDLMENKGLIWASDRAAWRLDLLKRRAARARVFNYRLASWDGGAKLPTKTKFDGVLMDAPCSGIGTWQRNPHARWTTTAADVAELALLQSELLGRAAKAVKPGGRLIYAVCTLARSETLGVAATFEKACPEFVRVPLANPLEPETAPEAELFLRPERWKGNGMFVAVWKRG